MRFSYSKWATYQQCPAKFKYSYIDKLPRTPPGPAAQRGNDIHNSVEQFMLGNNERLHDDIHSSFGQWLYSIRETTNTQPELKFTLDKDWNFINHNSKEDTYVTGFIDLCTDEEDDNVHIYEWKTGRVYDSHIEQRFLYGTIGLLLFPKCNSVTVHGVYFDQKKSPPPNTYHQETLDYSIETWDKRFSKVEQDEDYNPNPNFLCKYCDFSKDKGGPCPF